MVGKQAACPTQSTVRNDKIFHLKIMHSKFNIQHYTFPRSHPLIPSHAGISASNRFFVGRGKSLRIADISTIMALLRSLGGGRQSAVVSRQS